MPDTIMHVDERKRTHHDRAVEALAHETSTPAEEIARLCEEERADLAVGARISGFLGIFALRNVRKMLRQRLTRKRGTE